MKCEKLDVWKRSCRLSVEIYAYFKENRDFSFKDQITHSSLSIASNIAEGMEKDVGFKWVKESNELLKMLNGLKTNLKTKENS